MSHQLDHVIGARPNFIKAAPVIRGLGERGVTQRVVHTGQHYDERMSDVFFRELDLPEPDVYLGVGSGTHGEQTAATMVGLERAWSEDPPSLVVVYGDVNSTLAASLVALSPLAFRESAVVNPDLMLSLFVSVAILLSLRLLSFDGMR